tara:strand:- start:1039 stop:1491 length:453 start_codon:yes stop_codon:yes gene_type:complete
MILGTKVMKLGKAWLESQDLITSVKWMRRAGVTGIILAVFNIGAPVASLGGVSESGFGEDFITLPSLIIAFIVFIIILSLSVGILRQNKIAALGLLVTHVLINAVATIMGSVNTHPVAIVMFFVFMYVFLMGTKGTFSFYKLTHPEYPTN